MLRIGRAVFVATLVLASAAWGQGPGSKFGAIVGGATLSDFGGDFGGSSGSRWGGTAGLLLGVNAWRTAITLESDWVQKGGEDTRLDYIELPLTVGAIAVAGGGAMRARIYSGISFGFKLSCDSRHRRGLRRCIGHRMGLAVRASARQGQREQFLHRGGRQIHGGIVGRFRRRSTPTTGRGQFRLMFGKLLGTSAASY